MLTFSDIKIFYKMKPSHYKSLTKRSHKVLKCKVYFSIFSTIENLSHAACDVKTISTTSRRNELHLRTKWGSNKEKLQPELHSPFVRRLHFLPSHQEGQANPVRRTGFIQSTGKKQQQQRERVTEGSASDKTPALGSPQTRTHTQFCCPLPGTSRWHFLNSGFRMQKECTNTSRAS